MPNFEEQYGRAMAALCRKEGHTPSLIRVRKSGSSTIPIDRDIRGEILRILTKGPNKYHAICAQIDAPNGAVRQTLAGMKKTGELLANYPALKNHGAIWSLNPRQPGVSAPTASEHEKGAVRRNHPSNGSEPRQHAPLASPVRGAQGVAE